MTEPTAGPCGGAPGTSRDASTAVSAPGDVEVRVPAIGEARAGDSGLGNADIGSPRTANARDGRQNSSNRGRVAFAGWALYLLSWVTPSLDARQFGATAFVDSVRLVWHFFNIGSIAPGLGVTLGWLANFSIFLRLPCSLRVVASIAPWLAFAVVLANVPARAVFFLYFYPWALGIALIHAARCSSRKAAS